MKNLNLAEKEELIAALDLKLDKITIGKVRAQFVYPTTTYPDGLIEAYDDDGVTIARFPLDTNAWAIATCYNIGRREYERGFRDGKAHRSKQLKALLDEDS